MISRLLVITIRKGIVKVNSPTDGKLSLVGTLWRLVKSRVKVFRMDKEKRNSRKGGTLEAISWKGKTSISEEMFEFSCWA